MRKTVDSIWRRELPYRRDECISLDNLPKKKTYTMRFRACPAYISQLRKWESILARALFFTLPLTNAVNKNTTTNTATIVMPIVHNTVEQ